MDQDAVLDLFRKSGALLEGHFRLSSGLHSDRYLQSALVLQYPEFAEALGQALADRTRHLQPTVVLSPALGGIVIGQEVGRALGVRRSSPSVRTARSCCGAASRSTPSDRVLVVEDVITTGGSTRETAAVAEAFGAPRDRRRRDRRSRLGSRAPQPADAGAGAPRGADLRARGLPAVRQGRRRSSSPARGRRSRLSVVALRQRRISWMSCDQRTLKLTVEYDGTNYVGWQRQAEGVSIQGLLEEALAPFEGGR